MALLVGGQNAIGDDLGLGSVGRQFERDLVPERRVDRSRSHHSHPTLALFLAQCLCKALQSRLGRDPWIRPYTDQRLNELAAEGARRVAVLCPAFVADCLETPEEIGIRAREDFVAHGGEDLALIPSLNSEDVWAEAVVRIVREGSAIGVVAPAGGADDSGATE